MKGVARRMLRRNDLAELSAAGCNNRSYLAEGQAMLIRIEAWALDLDLHQFSLSVSALQHPPYPVEREDKSAPG